MIETYIAFVLGAASSGAAFVFAERAAKRERAALLDRVMSRDYSEYKAHEPRPVTPEPTQTEEERKDLVSFERALDEAHGLV